MIPEEIITALLRAHPRLVELVGADGIHPGLAPEGARVPCVVIKRVDAVQLHRPLSPVPGKPVLCRARMRVGAVYPVVGGYVQGKELCMAIRQACGNQRGTIAEHQGVIVGAPMASPEQPGTTSGLVIEPTDLMVTYFEPTA